MVMTGRWMRKLCLTRLLRAVTKPWQTLIEQEPGAGESERWRRTVRMPNHFTLQTQQAVRHIRREAHKYTSDGTHSLKRTVASRERENSLARRRKKRAPPQTTSSEKQKQRPDHCSSVTLQTIALAVGLASQCSFQLPPFWHPLTRFLLRFNFPPQKERWAHSLEHLGAKSKGAKIIMLLNTGLYVTYVIFNLKYFLSLICREIILGRLISSWVWRQNNQQTKTCLLSDDFSVPHDSS